MRPSPYSNGYSAAFTDTLGNFEHKHRRANFNAYQATPHQLKRIARRASQSLPQRLHPVTALFFLANISTHDGLRAKSAPDIAFDHRTHASVATHHQGTTAPPVMAARPDAVRLHRDLRSVHSPHVGRAGRIGAIQSLQSGEPKRTDMQMPRNVILNVAAENELVHFEGTGNENAAAQPAESTADASTQDHVAQALELPWHQQVDALTMTREARATLEGCNQQVHELLSRESMAVRKSHHVSQRLLIEEAINFSLLNAEAQATLARHLQRTSGFYGGHLDEPMSPAVQRKIIRDWIALNLFGQSVEDAIISMLLQHERAAHLRCDDLHRFIVKQAFGGALLSDRFKAWVLKHVLIEEVPSLGFAETDPASSDIDFPRLSGLHLDSLEWSLIHAGLRFAQLVGLGIDIHIKEAEAIGKHLLAQLQEGAAQAIWWDVFKLPALIHQVLETPDAMRNSEGRLKAAIEADAILAFANAHEQKANTHFPLIRFQNLLLDFMTRPQLAKHILKRQCPTLSVSSYLDQPQRPCNATVLDQNFHFLMVKPPAESLLPNLNQEFQKQIDAIAASYKILDSAILLTAWNTLSLDEINFIKSAQVRWVEATFSAKDTIKSAPFVGANPHAIDSLTRHPKPGVEFISAQSDGHAQRIYALHNKGLDYALERVDTDAEKYYAYFADALAFSETPEYKLILSTLQQVLKNADQTLETLSQSISEKHRNRLAQQLFDFGYEKTTREYVIDTLLSFIPFYTCITSSLKGKTHEAILACMVDSLSLIPFLGTLTSISVKLGHIVSTGSLIAIRNAVVEMSLRNQLHAALRKGGESFLRYAVLPTADALNKNAIRSISIAALRTMDPGIELIASIGAIPVRQANRLIKAMKVSDNALQPTLERIDALAKQMPMQVSPEKYFSATRPGIPEKVTVVKLDGDLHRGQPIYVQVNPASGQAYGRKYILLPDGKLDPVPLDVARHLQNILEQGLGGTGAIEQSTNWAAGEINAALLRHLRLEISQGNSLANLNTMLGLNSEHLHTYISDGGELTPLGNEVIDLDEAGPSHSRPETHDSESWKISRYTQDAYQIFPLDLSTSSARQIKPDPAVQRSFDVFEDTIIAHDGSTYWYDVDLNVFVETSSSPNGIVYVPDPETEGLISMTFGRAQDISTSISNDQRSAVIKALNIDVNIARILASTAPPPVDKMPVPKRISYIWVGNQQMDENLIALLDENRALANVLKYKVYFYLSQQAVDLNYDNLRRALACSETGLPSNEIQNELLILENTSLYAQFSNSIHFQQYRKAIEGPSTNFASATDILRLVILKDSGGFYMDVDDQLKPHFGDFEFTAADNEFLLPGPISNSLLGMQNQFGTSFIGSQPGNTLVDEILDEIHRRSTLPEFTDFYQNQRPDFNDREAFTTYATKLSQLTGPGVFNTVLGRRNPQITDFLEITKLMEVSQHPFTSQLIIQLLDKMPPPSEITPLEDCVEIGNKHTWEKYR